MDAITNLFEEGVKTFPNNPYLWEKKAGKYQSQNYSEVRDVVYKFAAGLISMGINKGDRIAILSEGRSEWVIGELGILYAGAISVPLSVKLIEESDILFRLQHSGSCMIIASQYQAKKLQGIKANLSTFQKIILLDEQETYDSKEISFKNILEKGSDFLKEHYQEFESRWKSVLPNDPANICYTSGTTADPKGIILTHLNYIANVEQSLSLIEVPEHFVTLVILPCDHSFAHTTGIYVEIKCGASIAFVQTGKTPMETLKNIPLNIKEIKPHFLLSVPALAKNFRKNVENGVSAKGKIAAMLFKFGLKVAYSYNGLGFDKGKGFSFLLKPVYSLIDKILFKKIRENFGGRLEFFVGGGALLDIELQRFFYAIGIPMMQGYGLTEASPVISSNDIRNHKLGSSGLPVKPMDIKICDDKGNSLAAGEKGEIVIRGGNVMLGYWNNAEATAQTIIDGWLHTGDMGYLDSDGFLYVLGRFKSLLIGDDGEKYSPEGIEEAFMAQSPFIEQCMLYNNQNPYTVALIVPNKEALKRWLKEKHHHSHHHNIDMSDEKKALLKLLELEINEYRTGNKYGNQFPQRWLPSAIAVLDEAFTEDNLMINSTMKLVRGKVVECYKSRIDYLYTPEAKNITNIQNIKAIEKILGI